MKQVDAGPPELIEDIGLRCGEQPQGGLERTRLYAGLGRCQRPIGATRRVSRQLNRAQQERGRSRDPAAGRCPIGGLLELHRDSLVRFHRGRCEMPGTTIGVDLCVSCRRKRRVY